ncbi:hypothetical protein EVAR_54945_1 [Eumeta japonica]|uniref:Uncharacterized protein n=1 Tax=Eumeta variegata TaxID=151549 RepID=A0A4C1YNG4_EUMVA|nr:hypothetical protein EVAR_54945_1 [Eumeta japonica]
MTQRSRSIQLRQRLLPVPEHNAIISPRTATALHVCQELTYLFLITFASSRDRGFDRLDVEQILLPCIPIHLASNHDPNPSSTIGSDKDLVLALKSDRGLTFGFHFGFTIDSDRSPTLGFEPYRIIHQKKYSKCANLNNEPRSTDVVFGRCRKRMSLTWIVSQVDATMFELVEPVINDSKGCSLIIKS